MNSQTPQNLMLYLCIRHWCSTSVAARHYFGHRFFRAYKLHLALQCCNALSLTFDAVLTLYFGHRFIDTPVSLVEKNMETSYQATPDFLLGYETSVLNGDSF
jgi:hypothetical protein